MTTKERQLSREVAKQFIVGNSSTVKVKWQSEIIECRISGFLNDFATVWGRTPNGKRGEMGIMVEWEFAWETVANAIRNNVVLDV